MKRKIIGQITLKDLPEEHLIHQSSPFNFLLFSEVFHTLVTSRHCLNCSNQRTIPFDRHRIQFVQKNGFNTSQLEVHHAIYEYSPVIEDFDITCFAFLHFRTTVIQPSEGQIAWLIFEISTPQNGRIADKDLASFHESRLMYSEKFYAKPKCLCL